MSDFAEMIKSILKENRSSIHIWISSVIWKIGNVAAVMLAWFVALGLLAIVAKPPHISEAAPLVAALVIAIILGVPFIYRPVQRLIGAPASIMVRVVILLTIVVMIPHLSESYEESQYNSLSPDEKEKLAREKELQALRDKERAEQESIAKAAREFDERQKINAEQQAEKEKRDIEIENSRQEEFYDQLGSPKLLYKCNGSPLKKAIGANFGTYNRLLEEANRACGYGGADILKKKE